jgi:hypothetical protein
MFIEAPFNVCTNPCVVMRKPIFNNIHVPLSHLSTNPKFIKGLLLSLHDSIDDKTIILNLKTCDDAFTIWLLVR